MFEKGAEIGEFLHRADELLQIFEPSRGLRRAVLAPHIGIAGFLQNQLGQFVMRLLLDQAGPAREIVEQRRAASARGFGFNSSVSTRKRAACISGMRCAPRIFVQHLQGRFAEAALGRVDDALEGEIVGGLRDAAQIGERVADFGALVEARAADDAVGQAERDEALLEFAHLERGAHQNGDVVERWPPRCNLLDLLADDARLLLAVPDARDGRLLAPLRRR